MKIIVVISSLRGGGAERVVSILSREWVKSYDVTIVVFDGSRIAYEYGGRIVDLRLPASGNPLIKARTAIVRAARLARLFRRERPDGIVSFMESANFPCIAAAAIARCLFRLRVSVRVDPRILRRGYRALMPRFYPLANGVVAPSDGIRKELIRMGVPDSKISVIHNPVMANNPVTTTDAGVAQGHANRAPEYGPFVLGVGRLHLQKGFDMLLRAFGRLDRTDLRLVILGEGSDREVIDSLARQLGIADRVHLPGAVSDVDRWYGSAECFVLSSRYEGWPNALMEALRTGCPAVSFDCPYGPAEIIDHGTSGLLVPQGDVHELSRAIAQVVGNPALRQRLAAGGRRRAKAFEATRIAGDWWDRRSGVT